MKLYKNANDTVRVGAMVKDGKFVIIIEKERKAIVATRRGKGIDTFYSHYEKTFDTPQQANAYFLGIKKNNPTLKEDK